MTTWMIIGIILLIAGFIFIGIEIVVPGFGLPGISGIACLIAGIILTSDSVEKGIFMTIVVIVILVLLATIILGLLHFRVIKSPIVLDDVSNPVKIIDNEDLQYLVNKEGMTLTDLRPLGRGRFDGIDFEVRSEDGYIQRDTSVKITEVKGNTLIVRKKNS